MNSITMSQIEAGEQVVIDRLKAKGLLPQEEVETGWVVHVVGPDDVVPQPNELQALRYANAYNTHMEKERRRFASDPNYPYCIAIVRRSDAPEVSTQ